MSQAKSRLTGSQQIVVVKIFIKLIKNNFLKNL